MRESERICQSRTTTWHAWRSTAPCSVRSYKHATLGWVDVTFHIFCRLGGFESRGEGWFAGKNERSSTCPVWGSKKIFAYSQGRHGSLRPRDLLSFSFASETRFRATTCLH